MLLISLGSTFTDQPAFYRDCLAAYGDLPGWHVMLQIGRHVDPADLGPEVARRGADLRAQLREAGGTKRAADLIEERLAR